MSTHLLRPSPADLSLIASEIKILVFRTNIHNKKDVKRLEPVMQKLAGIIKWNVDLKDIDKVLRIETKELQIQEIIDLITEAGYFCEELPG